MKKIKKLLAVLSTITVIATSSAYGISALEYEVYDVPDSITTIDELKETITEPIYISALDWARLGESMTEEELYEYFASNGVGEKEAESIVESYYDGLKQISESTCLFPVYPIGQEPERVEPNLTYREAEYVTGTSGTFESGVTYFYSEETKGLIFEGNGELSEDDFTKAMNSFNDIEFIFFGNDVTFECHYGSKFTAFFLALNQNWYNVVERPLIPTYTYEGSEYTKQFDECMKEIGANEGEFVYYTVEDGTDPYTFVDTLPELPTQIIDGGLFWDVDKTHTSHSWHYEGTVYDGISEGLLIINSIHDAPYTLEDVLKVVGDYAVTEVCLGETDMSVLPAELQNCETIEEAEAELLRLINEAKAEEQPIEETTEATVPTEVTEPTEAVEENTAETIVESVEILADEIAEDKTEITLGDVNGNGKADVRDVSFIAREIAGGKAADLPDSADYNKDGVKNIRDAATLAKELA